MWSQFNGLFELPFGVDADKKALLQSHAAKLLAEFVSMMLQLLPKSLAAEVADAVHTLMFDSTGELRNRRKLLDELSGYTPPPHITQVPAEERKSAAEEEADLEAAYEVIVRALLHCFQQPTDGVKRALGLQWWIHEAASFTTGPDRGVAAIPMTHLYTTVSKAMDEALKEQTALKGMDEEVFVKTWYAALAQLEADDRTKTMVHYEQLIMLRLYHAGMRNLNVFFLK